MSIRLLSETSPSARMLHGALIGIVATVMYLVLVFAKPGGFAAAVATQGLPLFWFSQAMRIAGCARRRPQSKDQARDCFPAR